MAHLTTPLLVIGFFSPVCRVSAVTTNKKSNESFISLRDYDFVGEDPRLKAMLSQRMAVLRGAVSPASPKAQRAQRTPAPPGMRHDPAYQRNSDYLHSSLSFPQMVNVSLDYAEVYNASELFPEMNVARHPPAPAAGLRGAPAPGAVPSGPAAEPTRVPDAASTPSPDAAPTPGSGAGPSLGAGFRRHIYQDPSRSDYNYKILELMKQCVYGAQLKILELDPIISRHQKDPRFRIAYIFNRVDEWLHDLRTAQYFMSGRRKRIQVRRGLIYYEQCLRINIDITYSIEHLVFLHSEYMKLMESLVSMAQRKEMSLKKKKGRQKLLDQKEKEKQKAIAKAKAKAKT